MRGNVSQLAEHYGKDTKQIYRWLKRYHLDPGAHR
jgi:transposase-like protein